MNTVIFIIIGIVLVYIAILLTLLWLKLRVYLLWNTRYQGAEYESAIKRPKKTKPIGEPVQTKHNGRSIVPSDELISLDDLPFEDGYKAIEALGNGKN